MSRSLMSGAMVPVSGESYGTSRAGSGTAGACRAARFGERGGGGGAEGGAPTSCGGATRCVSGSAGAGWVGLTRWRAAAIFALTFCTCSVICLHPEVAIINSAHVNSVLRRMSSLHRVKDTGAVLAAQGRGVAALRVRHDPHHVPTGVRHPGDLVRRAVRVVPHIAPHHAVRRLELGGRAGLHHIPPIAVRHRDLEHLTLVVQAGERRVG